MRLVVFHYHDRPGGVRGVIRRGLPALVERLGDVSEVVLLAGELTDTVWGGELAGALGKVPLRVESHAELGYGGHLSAEGEGLVSRVLLGQGGEKTVLWAHNLSVGRNLSLLKALPDLCLAAGTELWMQHHDWWWDGRWERWADWLDEGVDTLEEALRLSVPVGSWIRHLCVNAADLPALRSVEPAAVWTGVPLPARETPISSEISEARAWLREVTKGRPVWLAPVRALRRKNLAEALWLANRAGAALVTTGGASSSAEFPYWEKLSEAAVREGFPFFPGVLAEGARGPSVPALIAAADAVAVTSLREGFGLPFVEAASLGRPVVARVSAETRGNLKPLGCHVTGYERLPVAGVFERPRLPVISLPEELRAVRGGGVPDEFGTLAFEDQLVIMTTQTAPSVVPQVPSWPGCSKVDSWADRMLAPALPGGEVVSLAGEVERRFAWWLRHPLLWPGEKARR